MEKEKIIMLFGIILLLPLLSAQSFEIELTPKYFSGSEILVYNLDTQFDGISFEIVGENLLETRILNLQITKSAPDLFSEYLPDKIETLRILQEKTLWNSGIVDLNGFQNGETVFFIIGVEGTNEKTGEKIYVEEIFDIIINKSPKSKNIPMLLLIGERIYPSKPGVGVLVFFVIIIVLVYSIWYYKIPKKMDNFRKKMYKRRHGRK